jgi:DNA-binding NarL/FixJ family response regulator
MARPIVVSTTYEDLIFEIFSCRLVGIQQVGPQMKTRILLADDHPRFPEIEARLLEPEFEVIGTVGNGEALVEEALRLQPDVIITDISMPVLDGIKAVGRLRESGSTIRVVFLSVHSDSDFVTQCLSTGALAYVVKSRIVSELVPAIRHVLAGETFLSESLRDDN